MTCISCALTKARSLIADFGRSGVMPLVVLLTDGEQTVRGGDEAAIAAAEDVKAAGIDVVALSLGEANQYTLDRIASSPTETYSHTADGADATGPYGTAYSTRYTQHGDPPYVAYVVPVADSPYPVHRAPLYTVNFIRRSTCPRPWSQCQRVL